MFIVTDYAALSYFLNITSTHHDSRLKDTSEDNDTMNTRENS